MNTMQGNEWQNVKLHEIVNNEADIIAGPFGSNLKVSDYRKEGVPIIRLQNIERNKFIEKDIKYVSDQKAKELSYHSYNTGDIVLAKLGDPIGKTCIVPNFFKPGIVVADVVRIRPNERVNKVYLSYYLNSLDCVRQLNMNEIGTTRPRVNLSQIRNLIIKLPELRVQTAIANILSTVDEAIQKADEAIQKAECIKKAMLQKLFTEGIGHKEFKETKIGRIPTEWHIESAEKLCARVTDGTHDSPQPKTSGYLLFTSKNIKNGELTSEGSYFISKEDYTKVNMRSMVNTNDVLFSMIGTVGESAIVIDNPVEFAIKNVGLFKTNNDLPLASWLHYYFYSPIAKRYIDGNLKGTTQKYITLEALRNFPVVVPRKSERDIILSFLLPFDEILNLQKRRKFHLTIIKQGLMDALLTGSKRIKLD